MTGGSGNAGHMRDIIIHGKLRIKSGPENEFEDFLDSKHLPKDSDGVPQFNYKKKIRNVIYYKLARLIFQAQSPLNLNECKIELKDQKCLQ